MPLRENELARRDGAGLELRAEPLRVRWDFPGLASSDGHELRCTFTASVRALPDRTERRMLQELLLDGRTALFAEDVARHFFDALRGAAAKIAPRHEAKDWLESDGPQAELVEGLKAAAVPVAFACGLDVLPPFAVDLQSPSFERQRIRAMQQAVMEKEAAGQIEHFQRSAELLKQFHALREAAPSLSAGHVLEQISPADRGEVMQSLLQAAGAAAQATLWAVAGPFLLKVSASGPIDGRTPPRPELHSLPTTLGPLRSVQEIEVDGRPILLIGAQRGFFRVDATDLSRLTAYCDATFESPLGFNRVVYWPRRQQYCATHGEAGLVCWNAASPVAAARFIRSAALGIFPSMTAPDLSAASMSMSLRSGGVPMGPRNLVRLDDDSLLFSAGGRLIVWDGQLARTIAETGPSEVIAIIPRDRNLFIVHEDGSVAELDAATRTLTVLPRRMGKVRAAAAMPWLGESRLLLACDEGPVQCIGPDDPLISQYYSAHRGLRVVAGSAALVAAVSPDRQRVLLWNSWDGRQPACELFLGALARHRVADIAIA